MVGEIAMSLPALFLRLSVSKSTDVKKREAAFKKDRQKYEEEKQRKIRLAHAVAVAEEEARRKQEEERREIERLYRSLEEGGSSNPGEPEEGNEWFDTVAEFLLADSDVEDEKPMPTPAPVPAHAPAPAPAPAPEPKSQPVLTVHSAFKKKPKPKTMPHTEPVLVDRKKKPAKASAPVLEPPPVPK